MVTVAARRLIDEGFLLPEDAERVIKETEGRDHPYGLLSYLEDRHMGSDRK